MIMKDKKGFSLKEIIAGYKGYFFPNKESKELADKRLKICEECPELDLEGKFCAMPGTAPCCGKCGCQIKIKVCGGNKTSCPLKKW